MKTHMTLIRPAAALLAALSLSLASPSFAQPPGGPGGPPPPPDEPRPPRPPRPPHPHPPRPPHPHPRPPFPFTAKSSHNADVHALTARVQAKLQKLGYHSGAVDGQLGPVTSASIRSYQEKNGLEVTGRIDKPLLGSLEL